MPNGGSPLPDPDHLVTRQRLLEAAGEVFAEEGFANATVREICKRAGANIAAVHYHFGDKEKLYAAAVRYAHSCAVRMASAAELPADAPPEQRLRAFVRGFLLGVLSEGRPTWHGKLMVREMAEPTAVLRQIAEQGVKPRLAMLSGGTSGTSAEEPSLGWMDSVMAVLFPVTNQLIAAGGISYFRVGQVHDQGPVVGQR